MIENMMTQMNVKKICEVLLNHWDPIGIKDVPECQDEYDSYADVIYILAMKDDWDGVRTYMKDVVEINMRLKCANMQKIDEVIKILKS